MASKLPSTLNGERILITGATGFIGSHVLRALIANGAKPHIVARSQKSLWRIADLSKQFTTHKTDLTNKHSVDTLIQKVKPTIVYHLASYGVVSGQTESDILRKVNLDATIYLVDACSKLKHLTQFIHTGSCFEYGSQTSRITEQGVLLPETDYAVFKAASTLYCLKSAKREGMPITILRPFTAYGPTEAAARLIPTLMLNAMRGERPELSNPKPVRNFIHVEDVANAYLAVTGKSETFGEIYNVCTNQEYAIGDIVERLQQITGQSLMPRYNKQLMRQYEPTTWLASYAKLKAATSWKPSYSITQGLTSTYKWFQANHSLYS